MRLILPIICKFATLSRFRFDLSEGDAIGQQSINEIVVKDIQMKDTDLKTDANCGSSGFVDIGIALSYWILSMMLLRWLRICVVQVHLYCCGSSPSQCLHCQMQSPMRNPWFQTHEINRGPRRADTVDNMIWELWDASMDIWLNMEDTKDSISTTLMSSMASTLGNDCKRVWLEDFFVAGVRNSLNGFLALSGGIADLDWMIQGWVCASSKWLLIALLAYPWIFVWFTTFGNQRD